MVTANSGHACRVTERQQDRVQETLLARRNLRHIFRVGIMSPARKKNQLQSEHLELTNFGPQLFLFCFHSSFTNIPTTSTAFDPPTLPCESAGNINISLTLLRTKKCSQYFLPHQKSKHIYFSIILYQFYQINNRNNPKIPVPRWAQPTQAMLAGCIKYSINIQLSIIIFVPVANAREIYSCQKSNSYLQRMLEKYTAVKKLISTSQYKYAACQFGNIAASQYTCAADKRPFEAIATSVQQPIWSNTKVQDKRNPSRCGLQNPFSCLNTALDMIN